MMQGLGVEAGTIRTYAALERRRRVVPAPALHTLPLAPPRPPTPSPIKLKNRPSGAHFLDVPPPLEHDRRDRRAHGAPARGVGAFEGEECSTLQHLRLRFGVWEFRVHKVEDGHGAEEALHGVGFG